MTTITTITTTTITTINMQQSGGASFFVRDSAAVYAVAATVSAALP